jgi:hypothetical protein
VNIKLILLGQLGWAVTREEVWRRFIVMGPQKWVSYFCSFPAFETLCCDNKIEYIETPNMSARVVAVFCLFPLSILHWDGTVMWLLIFLRLILKSFQNLYSTLYKDVCLMQMMATTFQKKPPELQTVITSRVYLCSIHSAFRVVYILPFP